MLATLNEPPLTVSEAVHYLKKLLEQDELLRSLWVQGEISDYKVHLASGHCYFTLKDETAQLLCVFFKHARQRAGLPELRNGMAVLAAGYVSFYEQHGRLQLYVEYVEPLGEGALYRRFEQLKERLAAEGLFAEARKRPLPSAPAVIGVVTSLQAAALRDMLRVLRTRYPLAEVLIAPALVQGEEAPASIAAALDLLNEHGEAEVIIVARGGGSREELWAFNDELVARAIARSRIPVISGVGHETDVTIADLVADYRASTPTAAATIAVPDVARWRQDLLEWQRRLQECVLSYLAEQRERLLRAERDLRRASPRGQLDQQRQQLDDLSERLLVSMQTLLTLQRERLRGIARHLETLSPLETLARGYAIVRRAEDQALVTTVEQVHPGDRLLLQLANGSVTVQVLP
ncbi:MAG: exodeoxyribonuclease VII large subunit [Thermogemmatispora sp.]|jgi:exodeoxyribonuclease VII large subunit|uniref:exodeoxyribonuclease VII large subunit n=1 Tax=Thermogemmatispora sp. TaxID=1968838 RepID=UPI001A1019DD|nr:exodeoxyribonuclease VII large subunit [Thermogemmatispora sp.]MBE3568012.1 exodeoxyribonuclease VII large subunit [Thermogemmatispora sp.]